MTKIPLICPRCGHSQHVVPGDAGRPARVVHSTTGREQCPEDLADAHTAEQVARAEEAARQAGLAAQPDTAGAPGGAAPPGAAGAADTAV